ncbi:MAG: asparagine synthase (glutamine-hydrolyzing) [Kiritimatiellae bacterium]|nr:asparagine synthase (glutamine-hydrolyzing) [Kiritimatiellia bacterium]
MCGITGIFYPGGNKNVKHSVLNRMTDSLLHRGPDDRGTWIHKNVGLGFRRLSIIDLSSAGRQPMSNENESIWLVFNGEIYNFEMLRKTLLSKGHIFKSDTDSEVILHGYEEWGIDVVNHLDGMFAFSVWDTLNRRLFLARDRFGIKPLYYAKLPGEGVAFASEIKALLNIPDCPRQLDWEALGLFLTFAQVPAPKSIYTSIFKLLPGHRMVIDSSGSQTERYYQLPFQQAEVSSIDDASTALKQFLRRSIQSHVKADVPVGCFLSGGLDSSLLAAMASQETGPIKTFSVSFPDCPDVNEEAYQTLVSDHIKSEHITLPAHVDLLQGISKLIGVTDEPFAISSFLPLCYVAQLASEHVKVVLTGDGSDELFAGYHFRYTEDTRRAWLKYINPLIPSPHSQEERWDTKTKMNRIRRRIYLAQLDQPEKYISSYNWFTSSEKEVLLQQDVLELIPHHLENYADTFYERTVPHPIRRKMYYDMHTCLVDEMLTKTDRATSAASIEGRVPFLDKRTVEYAWSLPLEYLRSETSGKQILKKAAQGLVPESVINRPKKGFSVPLDRWMHNEMNLIREILLEKDSKFDSIIRPQAVKCLLEASQCGRGHLAEKLWVLAVLKCWITTRDS